MDIVDRVIIDRGPFYYLRRVAKQIERSVLLGGESLGALPSLIFAFEKDGLH